jgi:hypothetical protein
MACEMARREGERYLDKKHARSPGTASIASSHPSMIPERIQWAEQPTGPKTGPTASTSMNNDQHVYHRPPPPDWIDRVNTQKARDDTLRRFGNTEIPDQGVVFEGHVPYDAWTSPRRPTPNIAVATTELVVKEESMPHPTHVMLRCTNFIGNTSITPMSQQVYPGCLNPVSDPLLGPRSTDCSHSRDGQQNESLRARHDPILPVLGRQVSPIPLNKNRESYREPATRFLTLPPSKLDTRIRGDGE